MSFERIYSPAAFLITFSTYGTRLHGRDEGSVDAEHNQYNSPYLQPNQLRSTVERNNMLEPKFTLDRQQRAIVLKTACDVCLYKRWKLFAAHIRTEHVHLVLSCDCEPEKAMTTIKAWATRALKENCLSLEERKIWTRHGSTKYIWKNEHIYDAIDYVAARQGQVMELYYDKEHYRLPSSIIIPLSEPRP